MKCYLQTHGFVLLWYVLFMLFFTDLVKKSTKINVYKAWNGLSKFVRMSGEKSSWNSLQTNSDKSTSVIFVTNVWKYLYMLPRGQVKGISWYEGTLVF